MFAGHIEKNYECISIIFFVNNYFVYWLYFYCTAQLEQTNKYQYENTKLKEKVRDLEYYKKQYEVNSENCLSFSKNSLVRRVQNRIDWIF